MDKVALCVLVLGALMVPECGLAAAKKAQTKSKTPSEHWTSSSDVVWTSPSKDSSGSMPLGNGEVGINLWVEENGDLLFLISRTDSLGETAQIMKVGKLRVSLSPNPFVNGAPFRQHLRLRDGVCEIEAGSGNKKVSLRVFVDANQPVVHVAGRSQSPLRVLAKIESWREQPQPALSVWGLAHAPFPLVEAADIFPAATRDAVSWYHRNETSLAYDATMKLQSLESFSHLVPDPILHRTFGGWVTGTGFAPTDNRTLATSAPMKTFALRVAAPCLQARNLAEWNDAAKKAAAASSDAKAAQARTASWWRAFWNRSRVVVTGDENNEAPRNAHPLRIGYDSNRQSKLPGEIGRTTVYDRPLSPEEIVQLASAKNGVEAPVKTGMLVSGEGASQEFANAGLDFRKGFTLEAWVKTDGTRDGRIFDKVTSFQHFDGFLLDAYPKDSLRFVVGSNVLQGPSELLAANTWQHAAATYDAKSGTMVVYLNGKIIAERGANPRISVTQAYTLQRYMQACGGRGTYPIKFNGGIFTVEPTPTGRSFNVDWRAWGETYWYQNSRHMYHPMLAGGDIDMMEPFFRLYTRVRPLAEARTRLYHKAEGSYFPETMTVWGAYGNGDYGWDRTGKDVKEVIQMYTRYMWNQGPELVALMLDRWDYTGDKAFLQKETLPMAVSVLKYFDTRFKKDASGRVVVDPTQAVETYWEGVVNDTPTVAGLRDITARLCALPASATTPQQRAFFKHMKAATPVVPTEEVEVGGVKKRTLAPAQKYDAKTNNVETPGFYAIWPFRLYGVGRPDLETARTAYPRRIFPLDSGWAYDGNIAALLGMTDEAARILKVKCAASNPAYRWPATWGPHSDWLPDQNHGGNLLSTTQLMLLQNVDNRILVLPTWPKEWDVSFKLHAPQKTVVECVYRGGKIEKLVVTPASRRKNVVLPLGISAP